MRFNLILMMALFFFSECISAQESAGKTIMVKGKVSAHHDIDQKKVERILKRRSPIFAIDVITTGEKSQAQFTMNDGGLIALKENTILDIKDYNFNHETKKGSASIELLKGGLRSISGAIKKNGGDYEIQTPVGSIGIRGTHFEIQLVSESLYLAVWDGAIDVTLTNNDVLSLGSNEAYSFANITSSGEINRMLEPAAVFTTKASVVDNSDSESSETEDSKGQSPEAGDSKSQSSETEDSKDQSSEAGDSKSQSSTPDNRTSKQQKTSDKDIKPNSQPSSPTSSQERAPSPEQSPPKDQPMPNPATLSEPETSIPVLTNKVEDNGSAFVQTPITEPETELDIIDTPTAELINEDRFQGNTGQSLVDLIAQREGVFTYQAASFNVLSTEGDITDFSMFMKVDFDKGTVPSGEIAFKDTGGEWFATYNGLINVSDLELGITFGSHGNNTVEGDINAIFVDGIDAIKGEFDLREKLDPAVSAGGSFELEN